MSTKITQNQKRFDMKNRHEKFNYTARIAYICPCCDMEIGDSKPDYCPNCEVRMLYPIEQLEPEGEIEMTPIEDTVVAKLYTEDKAEQLEPAKSGNETPPKVGEMKTFETTIRRDEAEYFCEPYNKIKHGEPLNGGTMLLKASPQHTTFNLPTEGEMAKILISEFYIKEWDDGCDIPTECYIKSARSIIKRIGG